MKTNRVYLTAVLAVLTSTAMVTRATIADYGDFEANTLFYNEVTEATGYGEYGAPTITGDAITFSPNNLAAAAGYTSGEFANAPSLNDAELQFDVVAKAGKYVKDIEFAELGDYGMSGSALAGVQAKAFFYVTIYEIDNGDFYLNEPILETFEYDSGQILHPGGLFATSDDWGASIVFDMATILSDNFIAGYTNGVTKVHITVDNQLSAAAYPGSEALIKKKHTGGLTITADVVPEPASAVLLVGTTTLLGVIRRRFIV